MKKYKPVHIRCAHEMGMVTSERVSDFHLLTKKDIWNLLRRAKQTNDWKLRNSIQIRLCQGIRGYACPRVIDGPVAEKELQVSRLYLDNMKKNPTSILVNRFHKIMNL